MFEYHHIYTFFASSGIAGQVFECRILRRYDADNIPDWIRTTSDAEGNPVPIVEPVELESPKGEQTIDWARGNDVYAPMLGSKFDFTLLNVSGNDFIDFADGDFKEFRVDVINLIPRGSEIYKRWGNDAGNLLTHYAVVRHVPGRVIHNKIAETKRPNHTAQLYWRGFVHPVNSKEPILAPPFNVKYIAVDGLAELGERTIPFIKKDLCEENERHLRLIRIIQFGLEQTKTDLDLAVDSSIIYLIEDAAPQDALLESYVNGDAFDNKKIIDVIKGILSAFNCRLLQSNGYWYIYNVSLQNSYDSPKASASSINWVVYQNIDSKFNNRATDIFAGIDTDRHIRRSINGQYNDLIPMSSTLTQTLQQPLKLIECKPEELFAINSMKNPSFDFFNTITIDDDTYDTPLNTGSWTLYDEQVPAGQRTSDLPAGYQIDPLRLASAKQYPFLQSRALESKRLISEINTVADIWTVGTTYKELLGNRNILVSVRAHAWYTDRDIDRIGNNRDQILLSRDEIFGNIFIPFSVAIVGIDNKLRPYNFETNEFIGENDEISKKRDFKDILNMYDQITTISNKFQGNPNQSQYVSRLTIQGALKKTDVFDFQSTQVELNMTGSKGFSTTGRNSKGLVTSTYELKFILYYPQGDGTIIKFKLDPTNGYPNDNNIIGRTVALIDSVDISAKIPTNALNPTYTRVQAPFRRKETYSPYITHENERLIAQKIHKLNDTTNIKLYRRNTYNDDRSRRDNADTLEQITTQLKLNDFRRRTQVFEGDVASNHNGYPIFPIQMFDVDFNDWKSGRREDGKPEATIFWGGRYNLSTGIFSISTFTPNQESDIVPDNRAEIDNADFDSDGQLKPGYYTNRVTIAQGSGSGGGTSSGGGGTSSGGGSGTGGDIGGGTPTPTTPTLPQAATEWYHGSPNFIHIQEPEKNVYVKDIRTNGAFTLRGEIYAGKSKVLFGLTEDKGYKNLNINPYIVKGTKHIASFNMIFNCPVDGNENTKEIEIEFGRFQITPNALTEKQDVNNIISILNNINPDNTNIPATKTYHSGNSITGEKVEVNYHKALIFIKAHSRSVNAEGVPSVNRNAISNDKSNPIIISYEGRYLNIPEIPDVPLGKTLIDRDIITLSFTGGTARSINIDLSDAQQRNKSITADVTVNGLGFNDITFHVLSQLRNINTPITGITVSGALKNPSNQAVGTLTIQTNGYDLPIGSSTITASLVGSWGETIILRGSVSLIINIANHKTLPNF